MDEPTIEHLLALGVPEPTLDAMAYCEIIEENDVKLTPVETDLLAGIRALITKVEKLTKELETI